MPAKMAHRLWPFGIRSVLLIAIVLPVCAESGQDSEPAASAPAKKLDVDMSTGWPRPRSGERVAERNTMVATQIAARGVRDEAVLAAMRQVPRHWFVPKRRQAQAYADHPLPIGEDQTISQPYIVAMMTEALRVKADSKVLEVGTGSGYQAAVLAEITPHVFSIEIVEPLARRAMEAFAMHGYSTIKAKVGDGYAGWPAHAPFDVIIVTCAPDHVPPKLIEQLKPGGRLCIPVGGRRGVQSLRLVTKTVAGKLETTDLIPVRFVPMTGRAQDKSRGD